MALFYLRHPIHGEKVESSDIIAQMDRDNGWEDFDPSERKIPSFLRPSGTVLPNDFPGREALVEAGLSTTEQLVGMTSEQLQQIRGIGPAMARKILDAQ